jgi:hypothetical protein
MPKRTLRLLGKILSWSALVLVILCAAFYVLASWTPTAYLPPTLSQPQKEDAARAFVSDLARFQNNGQKGEPFDWIVKQDDMNRYLAAMDEIVASQPGRKRGEVQKVLDTAGITPPMVYLGDGHMTVMLRSVEHGKVLSADIAIGMTDDDKILAKLTDTRVGLLPVPRFTVRDRMAEFKATLQQRLDRLRSAPKQSSGGLVLASFGPIEELLSTLVLAIDEKPLPVQIRIHKRRVRIKDFRVEEGRLVLRIVPAPKTDEPEDD